VIKTKKTEIGPISACLLVLMRAGYAYISPAKRRYIRGE